MKRPTQKFQRYDLVRIAAGASWKHSEEGVVVGSYYEQFGGGRRERKIYTICFPGSGECSWFDEDAITLLEENRPDLMKLWGSRSTVRG